MAQECCEKCKSALIRITTTDQAYQECSYCGTIYEDGSCEELFEDDYNE